MARTANKPGATNTSRRFGRMIRETRLSKRWNVGFAARTCNYSEQQFRNLESGTSLPALERLESLCEAMGLDPLDTFRHWVNARLANDDSSRQLRRLLTGLDVRPETQALKRASSRTKALLHSAGTIPMDDPTARYAYQLIRLLSEFRREFSDPVPRKKHLRCSDFDNADSVAWGPLFAGGSTEQCVVGGSRTGFGYFATVVKFAPSRGGYHIHGFTGQLDSGMEFFSVLSGEGLGLFEHPTSRRWQRNTLRSKTVGLYRGDRGHAFLNTGTEDLLVYIVSAPYPPELENMNGEGTVAADGAAEAIEFTSSNYRTLSLPEGLRQALRESLDTKENTPDE